MRSSILRAAVVALVAGTAGMAYGQPPASQRDERRPSDAQARGTPKSGTPAPPSGPLGGNDQVRITSTVDRTAAWVGDPVTWTVEFTCAPTVDVIADDMTGDKIALSGLEMFGSETERISKSDGTTIVRVKYR